MFFHDAFISAATAQKSAMDFRMQRLDPAIHDFGKTGLVGYLDGFDVRLAKLSRRAAGGQDFHTQVGKAFDEGDQVALVRDTDERASHFEHLVNQRIGSEFFPQGSTVYSENACGLALIAVRIVHDGLEQRALDFAEHEVVKIPRTIPVETRKVILQRVLCVFAKWFFAF